LFTQEGNLILDARFDSIPEGYEAQINAITGVVENGIFGSQATEVLVGRESGVEILSRK
jgi:ribose 5-phosphate isomerase A